MLQIFCTDSALNVGRIDSSMLDSQQMMALFFTPDDFVEMREVFGGNEDNACTWAGVSYDGDRNIVKILWGIWGIWGTGDSSFNGSINFSLIPKTLDKIKLNEQKELRGEVDMRYLPAVLNYFYLEDCAFTGTLDMGSLSRSLIVLHIFFNRIEKIVNFHNLPPDLFECDIAEDGVREQEMFIGRFPNTYLKVGFSGCNIERVRCECPKDARRIMLNFGMASLQYFYQKGSS